MMTYQLIDSGAGEKLEQVGDYRIVRPTAQALWNKKHSEEEWQNVDAVFNRDTGWIMKKALPDSWVVELMGIKFKISLTDFGHIGLFPEHSIHWNDLQANQLLNLFAYSGGATLAAAKTGASVCHVDASHGMVQWARENAALNDLGNAPIRWIVDDVVKFLKREIRRNKKYDSLILDPPTFGRGRKGEVFKIEEDLQHLLELCRQVLLHKPKFVILSCHTPGMTPTTLCNLLQEVFGDGQMDSGEMLLGETYPLPSGCYARWSV